MCLSLNVQLPNTVPASGKLTHSTSQLAAGLRLNTGSHRQQEAFVITGIPDICPVLLFMNRLPDNDSRNNDNSHTVGY